MNVNIGQAKTRLSELVAAALRGEDVVVAKAGRPQVRLVPIASGTAVSDEERRARRMSAIGMFDHLAADGGVEVGPSMIDEEMEERFRRKFGPAA